MTVVKTKIRQDPLINKVLFNSDTVRPYRSLAARAIRMYLSQVTRTVGHSVAVALLHVLNFILDFILDFKKIYATRKRKTQIFLK